MRWRLFASGLRHSLIRPDTRRFAYQLLAWTYKYELREQSFLKYLPPSARLVVWLRLK